MLDTIVGAAVEAASQTGPDFTVSRPAQSATARRAARVPRGWEAFARCVEHRESRGQSDNVNPSSGAAGLFQFMPAWRGSLPYVISERLGQFGMAAKQRAKVRTYLFRVHYIHKYPAVYQRIAFAEVLDDGLWVHWYLAGSRCNGMAQ